MHQRVALLAAILTTLAQPARLNAQEHDHQHQIGQLGRVVFPVSCTPQARQRFEHAMAVLHSFWWEEGDRAFGQVLEADSSCAMAYWGKALNAWGNPFAGGPTGDALTKGAEAARHASSLPAGTARERGFIAATAALYRNADSTPNSARLKAYADSMARLYQRFPKDVEVAIYYALSQMATAPRTDTTFAQQKRAIAILDPLFAQHPDHPGLAHYVIHATDSPGLARLGLDAARRYAKIAPAAPHAQHMPSHIFVRLGLWNETIASNWKSYQAGHDYAKAMGIRARWRSSTPWTTPSMAISNGARTRRRARRWPGRCETKPSLRGLVSDYNRTAMAARVPLERGDWAAAAELRAPAESLRPGSECPAPVHPRDRQRAQRPGRRGRVPR